MARARHAGAIVALGMASASGVACGGLAASDGPDAAAPDAYVADVAVLDAPAQGAEGAAPHANATCSSLDGGAAYTSAAMPRVPASHRQAPTSCSVARVAGITCTCPDAASCGCNCATDSDCDGGVNGRCLSAGTLGGSYCSYDDCSADSDCRAGQACACRAPNFANAPNVCVTAGDCATDDDCGPGGYCSPSLILAGRCQCLGSPALCVGDAGGCYVGKAGITGLPPGPGWTEVPCDCGDGCGHGYYCHTPCDACVDDGDCGPGATCNYDIVHHVWACATCEGIP